MYIIKLNLGNIYTRKSASSNFVVSKLGKIQMESSGLVVRLNWRKFFSTLRSGSMLTVSNDINKRISLYLY
jgi:hypothetical protein